MEKLKINRKFVLLVVLILVLFIIFLWFLFPANKNSKSNLTPTPIKPTQFPSTKTESFKDSFNENDPQLWIDEDGKRITGDN